MNSSRAYENFALSLSTRIGEQHFFVLLRQTFRLMIEIPDYQTYLDHQREKHPGVQAMNPEEFFRNSQARRYDSSRTRRCC